jgi:serine/threonine protein kinase
MSYCLNPDCQQPLNPKDGQFCQSCGQKLRLGDRYRAVKSIGQGGFGRTFLGVDEYKPSQPYCAIKQFFPQSQSSRQPEKAAELFRQEAIRLDELGKHPQIPELLAHFEVNNYQYLVQEFIPGETLERELADRGAFNEREIRLVLADLLPVLQFVHEKQVIHRDIKPENIIRRPIFTGKGDRETEESQLVLVDFGASKFATATALGRTGTVIGTAGYAAPEQTIGKAVTASDLYGLGVTCLHLLTAIAPFDLYDLDRGVWVWRDYLNESISPQLGEILDGLVENNLNRRFHSAKEVLERVQNLPPLSTYKSSPPPRSSAASGPPPYRSPIASFIGGTRQLVTGWLVEKLGDYDGAIAAYDRAISANPDRPEPWYKKGHACLELKRYEEAKQCYEKVLELKPNHVRCLGDRGLLMFILKDYAQSFLSYERCLELDPNQPFVCLHCSLVAKLCGRDREAEKYFDRAQKLLPQSESNTMVMQAWEMLIRSRSARSRI